MHRYDPARQRLAFGLAGLAGLVDATGFVVAGGYFTSFMSGNTTRMGVELVERPALALAPLGLIGCFLAGVISGAIIGRRFKGRHKRVLLGLVAALLGAAVVMTIDGPAVHKPLCGVLRQWMPAGGGGGGGGGDGDGG
jgi:uncharacterized membrane protein YoaK (UPF0700 family)